MARPGKSKRTKKTTKKQPIKPAIAAPPKPTIKKTVKKTAKKATPSTPRPRAATPSPPTVNAKPKTNAKLGRAVSKSAVVAAADELLVAPVRVMPAGDPQPELILKPEASPPQPSRAIRSESNNRNAPPPMSFYRPAASNRPASGAPSFAQSPPPQPAPAAPVAEVIAPQNRNTSVSTIERPSEPESTAMRSTTAATPSPAPVSSDVPKLAEAPPAQARPPVIPSPPPEDRRPHAPAAPAPAPAQPPPAPVREPEPVEPPKTEPEPAKTPAEPILFEIAWEVCWQLGGIYTVLKSKANAMLQRWGDRYCLIGPYNPQTAAYEFDEHAPTGVFRDAIEALAHAGIPAKFGRWLIPGRPQVILIDYRARYNALDSDKYLLWHDHHISAPANDGEVNEVVAFGFATAEFFARLASAVGDRPILAHFHEWMAGVAIPRIAHMRLPIATIFTTHATLLGRYIAGDSPEFYNHLPYINADEQAAKYQIYPRFAIERAAAHASTVFTTVSEVTATEAEKLLGRKPDAIVPNGLNIQRFAALHEFQNLHQVYKERIHEFVMGHFFPSYTFDLDRTIYFVTSGRYEYRNKGFDLFIEAMYRLNQRLKAMPDRPTVVAFIVTRAWTRHINVGVLQRESMFEDLKHVCSGLERQMGGRLFRAAANGRLPQMKDLLNDDELLRLRQSIQAWRTGPLPAIVTHDLVDDATDPVLQHLRHRQLFNSADDPVKMIFHPEFVTATSPLFKLDYQQFVRGCHMGIFPSYYEPWGYTPMECVALGLPAVTTDLSGFGAYVEHHVPNAAHQGICVLNRRTKSFEETTNNLVDYVMNFVQLSRRQRIEMRNRVERLSELFDWSALVIHYHEAHDMALQRLTAGRASTGRLEVRMV
ncbi:MAG TPA: glycosyltransferase [Tepidisphaeraceae bacterium]|nr:glycosyltransferase [Tepidisphaeraceae bacterium]